MKPIPFNWDLYQTGKYTAVYRDSPIKILNIKQFQYPGYPEFKFVTNDEFGNSWYITELGRIFLNMEDENDVFLIEKPI